MNGASTEPASGRDPAGLLAAAGTRASGPPTSGRHLVHDDLFRPVEVPEQRYFGTVMQYLLVHPTDRVDEDVLGIAAIRIGAQPDGGQRGVVGGQQGRAPRGCGLAEYGDRAASVTGNHTIAAG